MDKSNKLDFQTIAHLQAFSSPLMVREDWARHIGLPVSVVIAQCERGYWPTVTIGKRCLVNVEAVRIAAARKAEAYTL